MDLSFVGSLKENPCVSADFCLHPESFHTRALTEHPLSRFSTEHGSWLLAEDPENGDCGWILTPLSAGGSIEPPLRGGRPWGGADSPARVIFPATWQNLLLLKEIVTRHDAKSTIFPSAAGTLGHSSLGIGARFTTMHWPAVDWTMAQLGLSLTANQNVGTIFSLCFGSFFFFFSSFEFSSFEF